VPVIMLMNDEHEQVRSLAEAEGATGFLIKPTTSQEVVDIVSQTLG
jgi:DNA-binding NarL/FixJ family response regulator